MLPSYILSLREGLEAALIMVGQSPTIIGIVLGALRQMRRRDLIIPVWSGALSATLASDARQTILGSFLGLGTATLLGWSLFATTTRLDLRRFF
jgi:high-affinity Fe2+/Pb2+ permease